MRENRLFSSMIYEPTGEDQGADFLRASGITLVDPDTKEILPDEDRTVYSDLHKQITSGTVVNKRLYSFFSKCMTPYFKGEKNLDICVYDFKNQLSLYVSE